MVRLVDVERVLVLAEEAALALFDLGFAGMKINFRKTKRLFYPFALGRKSIAAMFIAEKGLRCISVD